MSKGIRTNIDFSKHKLHIFEQDNILIYKFREDNTNINSTIFINTCGVMSVTGDFGNWIFCREFHLSDKSGVSAGYWDEKLRIASEQKSHEYDAEETVRLINKIRDEYEDDYGEKMSEKVSDWLDELERKSDDELEYTYFAFRDYDGNPLGWDYEYIPLGKKRHIWLECIYDSFDEMSERFKKGDYIKHDTRTQNT